MHSLFKEDGKKHYLIAIGATLLILSHTITTVYAAIFCVIYILFYLPKLKDKEVIKKLFINLIFILLMSSLFTLPMLEAKQSTDYCIFIDSIMRTTPSFTHSNSLEFFEFFWDVGEENATTYIIGIPVLLLLLLSFYTIRKVDTKYKDAYIIFATLGILALYITTKYFPWRMMPSLLCKLQYPWRLVGFFNFFSSLVCGINLYIVINKFVKKDWLKVIVLLIVLALSLCYTLNVLNKFKSTDLQKDEKYENLVLENPQIGHMKVNRDYLPVKAIFLQDTYMKTKQNKTDVLQGNAQILNEEKEKLNMSMDIENGEKDTILEFPYIYYPGYKVTLTINDTIKEIETVESVHGYVAIKLPEDIQKGKLQVFFEVTTITKVAYITSFISAIIFAIYVFGEKRRGEGKCIKA